MNERIKSKGAITKPKCTDDEIPPGNAEYQAFVSNGFVEKRIEDISDMVIMTDGLAEDIDNYVKKIAEELKCTSDEYLSVVNYWRRPCPLAEHLNVKIVPELLFELEKCFGRDIVPTTSFVINMKNVAIDERWANISNSPYEFWIWTPLFIDELCDRLEISTKCDDANGNVAHERKQFTTELDVSFVLYHKTKFNFFGPTMDVNHFYFVSEWKRNGVKLSNNGDQINKNLFIGLDEYNKVMHILLLGLRRMRRLRRLRYDLEQCMDEWLNILDLYESESVFLPNRFIDRCINLPVAKQMLKLFAIHRKARDHHGRNLCERQILKKLETSLLKPIIVYSKLKNSRNQKF